MRAEDSAPARRAAAVASQVAGARPVALQRFTTGLAHFVFEACFVDRPALVVRVGDASTRDRMAAGLRVQARLRAQGVPLPAVIAVALDDAWPCVVFERLAGSDLGEVIRGLSSATLDTVAARVAEAQAITARTPAAGRYGYAADAQDAPLAAWSQVLDANLARARARITAAGLFDPDVVERVAGHVAAARHELDALPAVAFLHDTTTKNVIVTPDGAVSGIVDVDDLCFGDPRYAPALTRAALLAWDGPVAYVEAWMRHASYRDDRLFRLYVAVFLVDLMSEHGLRFTGNRQPSTESERAVLHRAFDAAIRDLAAAPDLL